MLKGKKSINKQQLIIEFVSVVFAVILALILNSWRESSALNASLAKVKSSIKNEAVRNDSLLKLSNTYRKDLLQKFYSNQNELFAAPTADFPVDVNDNTRLASFFRSSLLFGQKEFYHDVRVLQQGENRVLVMDDRVYDVKIKNDTLRLLGIGNIQLREPDLGNRSWQLAQATGTIVRMDVELVEKLSLINTLIEAYVRTSENAMQMIYSGRQKGLVSVIEDMYNLEKEMLKANSDLLSEL